jgi:hypothetical protein
LEPGAAGHRVPLVPREGKCFLKWSFLLLESRNVHYYSGGMRRYRMIAREEPPHRKFR